VIVDHGSRCHRSSTRGPRRDATNALDQLNHAAVRLGAQDGAGF
jgi:hypothetical protein